MPKITDTLVQLKNNTNRILTQKLIDHYGSNVIISHDEFKRVTCFDTLDKPEQSQQLVVLTEDGWTPIKFVYMLNDILIVAIDFGSDEPYGYYSPDVDKYTKLNNIKDEYMTYDTDYVTVRPLTHMDIRKLVRF